jgi:hypothetical protein
MSLLEPLGIPLEMFKGIPLPTVPLNTDGIDYYGTNAVFRRIKITNFDDTIVLKPLNS